SRADKPPRRNRVAAVLAEVPAGDPVDWRVEMGAGVFAEPERVPVPGRPLVVVSRDHVDRHTGRRREDWRQADDRRPRSERLREVDNPQSAGLEVVNELRQRGCHESDTYELRTGSRSSNNRSRIPA